MKAYFLPAGFIIKTCFLSYSGKKEDAMEKIEISTHEPEKVLPILRDAIERQKRILSQRLARTQERIQQRVTQLQVN